ncbi:MAG: hypothetical protein N2A40_02840, partial [Desulfobulbaceae bacterium]
VRGLAVWSLGHLRAVTAANSLLPLATDSSQVRLYSQGQVRTFSVAELVQDALIQLNHPL